MEITQARRKTYRTYDDQLSHDIIPLQVLNAPIDHLIFQKHKWPYIQMLRENDWGQWIENNYSFGPVITKSINEQYGDWFRKHNLSFGLMKYRMLGPSDCVASFTLTNPSLGILVDDGASEAVKQHAIKQVEEDVKKLNNLALMFKMTFC